MIKNLLKLTSLPLFASLSAAVIPSAIQAMEFGANTENDSCSINEIADETLELILSQNSNELIDITAISHVQNNISLVSKKWNVISNVISKNIPFSLRLGESIPFCDSDFFRLINKFSNLTSLDLGDNNTITDASLCLATKLKIFKIGWNTKITDQGLGKLTALTCLELGGNQNITDSSLSLLTNLTDLHLGNNNDITEQGIRALSHLTRLHTGYNANMSDEYLGTLTQLTTLITDGS